MRQPVHVDVCGYGHYWFWLVTYDTREDLKRAAEVYVGHGLPDMVTDDEYGIEGCFSDNTLKTNYLGIMRLYSLSYTTIIHESVHAAISLAAKVHGKSRTLSRAKEEAVAYAASDIALAVAEVLHPLESVVQ